MLHALYHLLHPCLSWWVTNAVSHEDWLGGLLLLVFLHSKKDELARTHKKTYVDFEEQVSPHLVWHPWALLRWGRGPISQHSVIPVMKLLPSIITPLRGPCRYWTYSKCGNFSCASMSICQLHILSRLSSTTNWLQHIHLLFRPPQTQTRIIFTNNPCDTVFFLKRVQWKSHKYVYVIIWCYESKLKIYCTPSNAWATKYAFGKQDWTYSTCLIQWFGSRHKWGPHGPSLERRLSSCGNPTGGPGTIEVLKVDTWVQVVRKANHGHWTLCPFIVDRDIYIYIYIIYIYIFFPNRHS